MKPHRPLEPDSCNCEQDNITYHSFPLAFPTRTKGRDKALSPTLFSYTDHFPHDRSFSFFPRSLVFCVVFLGWVI